MTQTGSGPDPQVAAFLSAAAHDLALLARLHDRELDAPFARALAEQPARDWFAILMEGEPARSAFMLIDGFLADVAKAPDATVPLDEAAADFADLYLTFGKRVAPNESYWLTDDHIERQEPMFDVRGWYEHYGVKAEDWRKRADDHLVHQLQFVAALLSDGRPHALADAGRFLDRHLLRWSKEFLGGVAMKADTGFYAGLALISQVLLDIVRATLATITGEAVAVVPPKQAARGGVAADAQAFVPGAQPGW